MLLWCKTLLLESEIPANGGIKIGFWVMAVLWTAGGLKEYVRYVHPAKCSPHSKDTDTNIVCNEDTAGVKAVLALDCFYFHEYVTENLNTNLLWWMLHGCKLPSFFKCLVRNIHTNIPEDFCNLWRQGRKMSASENQFDSNKVKLKL